jgi:DNA polymerase elongation subunit (family B)
LIYQYNTLSKTLFIDIETVSEFRNYKDLTDRYKSLWQKKASVLQRQNEPLTKSDFENLYASRAAIYAEFGKIVCISCGFLKEGELRIKSIKSHEEKQILDEFADLLINYYDDPGDYYLCGHNIKEFDVPYICRRMVKHGTFMPNMLDIAGKKPWQTEHLIDTMELWKFGDRKSYTSVALLTAMLDIDSPKEDIDGSMVGQVYWVENDLKRIARYCSNDVVSLAQIMMKYCGQDLIEEHNIVFVE